MSVRKEIANELIEVISVIIEEIEIEYGGDQPTFPIDARASISNQVMRMERLNRWEDLERYLREEERSLRSKLGRMRNKRLLAERDAINKAVTEKRARNGKLVARSLAFIVTSIIPIVISAMVNWHTIASKWPW